MSKNTSREKATPITLEAARLLVLSDGIEGVVISQTSGKWAVTLHGSSNFVLKTARGDIRLFTSLEAAAKAVQSIGAGTAIIRLDNWQSNQEAIWTAK